MTVKILRTAQFNTLQLVQSLYYSNPRQDSITHPYALNLSKKIMLTCLLMPSYENYTRPRRISPFDSIGPT
jgi:hypothetical protein